MWYTEIFGIAKKIKRLYLSSQKWSLTHYVLKLLTKSCPSILWWGISQNMQVCCIFSKMLASTVCKRRTYTCILKLAWRLLGKSVFKPCKLLRIFSLECVQFAMVDYEVSWNQKISQIHRINSQLKVGEFDANCENPPKSRDSFLALGCHVSI